MNHLVELCPEILELTTVVFTSDPDDKEWLEKYANYVGAKLEETGFIGGHLIYRLTGQQRRIVQLLRHLGRHEKKCEIRKVLGTQ